MIADILRRKIEEYAPANELEQENVLQEMMQCYLLAYLARTDFFQKAQFHGGTCLRLLHGMERFSEDLDFILNAPDLSFRWRSYLETVHDGCAGEGIQLEVLDRSETEGAVKKAFLKTDSIGKVIAIQLAFKRRETRKIKIKLEIDTNPPKGSRADVHYLLFPFAVPIAAQNLECGFALKTHALLCRGYIKGRDWFDFIWYAARRIIPDLALLESALRQQGPWAGQNLRVTKAWLVQALQEKIAAIDWKKAMNEIRRFVPQQRQKDLDSWSADFFTYQLARLKDYWLAKKE
ncbi:MAG: nucleotidyl transferase AbiEii/AbiGii toxin family protein [Candidatus Sumerlaeota bacterium]|nr:nucleotidyl transferase AbiEii/AbiGii toxin family protein [Candidatus Sumerlaeota bacterium]